MKALIAAFLLLVSQAAHAQTIPVGVGTSEEALRFRQIAGTQDSAGSFMIRPMAASGFVGADSALSRLLQQSAMPERSFLGGKAGYRWLPFSFSQQFNAHHPFGWNDGSMIQAKGYQGRLSAGLFAQAGPVTLQLMPEWVVAQNAPFSTFPLNHSDRLWQTNADLLNQTDIPEKYGLGNYTRLFAGQSSFRLHVKKLSFGVSTENLWWGPGIRNALIMSNNAPGFLHLSFQTQRPVSSPVGHFEWQLIAGLLQNSGIAPADTSRTINGRRWYEAKSNSSRYINGLVLTWQPKWTKGFYLGASRVFYQYKNNVQASLNGYLPVVSSLFKSGTIDENSFGRDQMLSVFFRWVLPESGLELYGEYGRNDHNQDFRDLSLEPEHARAYLIGLQKLTQLGRGRQFHLFAELTQLQRPSTANVRETPTWYLHHQVRHGYTHQGQVIGAGIGPGSNSQSIGANWIRGGYKTGFLIDRIVRNNDFYYTAFAGTGNFGKHWVDYAFSLNKTWQKNKFLFSGNLTYIRSLNYQWQHDAHNFQLRLATSYLLW